jgi:hypothetical protein
MFIATLVTCVDRAKESVLEFPQLYCRERFPPCGETSPLSRELINRVSAKNQQLHSTMYT